MNKKTESLRRRTLCIVCAVASVAGTTALFLLLMTHERPGPGTRKHGVEVEAKALVDPACGKYEILTNTGGLSVVLPRVRKAKEVDITQRDYVKVKTCSGNYDHLLIPWHNIKWIKIK